MSTSAEYTKLKDNRNDWNTGDILLFCNKTSCFGKTIKYFTGSSFTHVGMILKNPTITNPPLIGLYFWESANENYNDVEDHKKKFGVEIVDLNELLNRCGSIEVYYRKLNFHRKQHIDYNKLKQIHNDVHNKPYDIVPTDWIEAYLKFDPQPQKRDRFWCSALLGYIFVNLGFLPPNIDWSIMRPSDFSSERKDLPLVNVSFEKEVRIQ